MKANDVKLKGGLGVGGVGGAVSAVVYGCSGLSPVKTQLIVINGEDGSEFCLVENHISIPPQIKAFLILHRTTIALL